MPGVEASLAANAQRRHRLGSNQLLIEDSDSGSENSDMDGESDLSKDQGQMTKKATRML